MNSYEKRNWTLGIAIVAIVMSLVALGMSWQNRMVLMGESMDYPVAEVSDQVSEQMMKFQSDVNSFELALSQLNDPEERKQFAIERRENFRMQYEQASIEVQQQWQQLDTVLANIENNTADTLSDSFQALSDYFASVARTQ